MQRIIVKEEEIRIYSINMGKSIWTYRSSSRIDK